MSLHLLWLCLTTNYFITFRLTRERGYCYTFPLLRHVLAQGTLLTSALIPIEVAS